MNLWDQFINGLHLPLALRSLFFGNGVVLTIRYLCDPRNRRSSETQIWEDILHAFAATPGIDLAYPTRRFYDHAKEGSSASGSNG